MRFVAPLKSINEIHKLTQLGVDAFLVMPRGFSRNEVTAFTVDEIQRIVEIAKMHSKQVYLAFNFIVHEMMLDALNSFIKSITHLDISAYVIYDLSMVPLFAKYHLESRCIYQPGTMNTNRYDLAFFEKQRIKGFTVSRELTINEVEEILKTPSTLEYSIVGHGYLEMFYSRRPLLTNYFNFKNQETVISWNDQESFLVEELRKDDHFPILETQFGTSIFRSHKLWSFSQLESFKSRVQDFFLERIWMDDEEFFDSIEAYQNQEKQTAFIEKYAMTYDSGFYLRKTGRSKGDLL